MGRKYVTWETAGLKADHKKTKWNKNLITVSLLPYSLCNMDLSAFASSATVGTAVLYFIRKYLVSYLPRK